MVQLTIPALYNALHACEVAVDVYRMVAARLEQVSDRLRLSHADFHHQPATILQIEVCLGGKALMEVEWVFAEEGDRGFPIPHFGLQAHAFAMGYIRWV